jgi:hypothetical protein
VLQIDFDSVGHLREVGERRDDGRAPRRIGERGVVAIRRERRADVVGERDAEANRVAHLLNRAHLPRERRARVGIERRDVAVRAHRRAEQDDLAEHAMRRRRSELRGLPRVERAAFHDDARIARRDRLRVLRAEVLDGRTFRAARREGARTARHHRCEEKSLHFPNSQRSPAEPPFNALNS